MILHVKIVEYSLKMCLCISLWILSVVNYWNGYQVL